MEVVESRVFCGNHVADSTRNPRSGLNCVILDRESVKRVLSKYDTVQSFQALPSLGVGVDALLMPHEPLFTFNSINI